jgi:hypothetical protein
MRKERRHGMKTRGKQMREIRERRGKARIADGQESEEGMRKVIKNYE